MSKMDGLRAMREARYAAATKAAAKPTASKPTATKPTATKPVVAPVAGADAEADELCGHRNMGGRSCTREKGHAAKSHRYS